MGFLGMLRALQIADGVLFDILPDQEDAPLQCTCAKGLRINDLSNNAALRPASTGVSCIICTRPSILRASLSRSRTSLPSRWGTRRTAIPAATKSTWVRFFFLPFAGWQWDSRRSYISGNTNRWTYEYLWMFSEILGDPYSKKSPLPGIGNTTHLPVTPSLPDHRILGKS
jgi:hypothetical protein